MVGRSLRVTEKGVHMAPIYEPPVLRVLGSVAELTQQFNKIGPTPDGFTNATPIVGSVVPVGG